MSRKNSARTPVGAVTVTSPLVGDGTVTGCVRPMSAAVAIVVTRTAWRTATESRWLV